MDADEFAGRPDVQRISATAVAYRTLQSLAPMTVGDASPFGGKLLLCAGLNGRGVAYSLAMSIAGGAFLGIDPRPARLKEALRDGVCDYMVNSLDEALRVLKNEIRKKTTVSVGLVGDTMSVLSEAAERGVQPEYFFADEGPQNRSVWQVFTRRGSVDLALVPEVDDGKMLVIASAGSSAELRVFECTVEQALTGMGPSQKRWMDSSPRYFRRTTPAMQSALLDTRQIAQLGLGPSPERPETDLMVAVQVAARGEWRLQRLAAGARRA